MSTYTIIQGASNSQPLPLLFTELCTFVGSLDHGTLGWFDTFGPEPIPEEWEPSAAARLNANGFTFLGLPDGSMVVLLDTGVTGAPCAVVYLGSEGEYHTIANSLEEFIKLWSTGETGITDLDDEDVSGRGQLVAWIKARKLKVPKAAEFDFGGWLAGDAKAATTAPNEVSRKPTADYEKLGPKMRALVDMMGRRADDPALIDWVTTTLGKKVPAHTTHDSANVEAPKVGLELVFSHDVLNNNYLPIKKSARSFIPYLSHAWVRQKIDEPIFGLDLKKSTEEDAIRVLGEPDGRRPEFMDENEPKIAYWERVVDAGADVMITIEYDERLCIDVYVASAAKLEAFPDTSTHVFVAWAAENGLLDETRFADHADLLTKIKKRQALGSELVRAALPRGLWDSHLANNTDLRRTAYQWFHNMGGLGITKDLKKVFGAKKGDDDPKLDDDNWDTVDAAAQAFEKVFGKWI